MSNELKTRIVFEGLLIPQTPFRIGSSSLEGEVRNPVFCTQTPNHAELLVIPSSSIRGILRNEFIRLLTAKDANNAYCFQTSQIPDENHHCQFCEFFGNQIRKGKLKIMDCYPTSHQNTINIKPRIAIDRNSRIVKKGQIAFFEMVSPLQPFHFKLILENINVTTDEYRLFLFTLYELMTGKIKIGGLKSAGLGSFTIEDFKVYLYDFKIKKTLQIRPEIRNFQDYFNGNLK